MTENRVPGDAEYGLLGPLTVRRAGAEVQVAPGKQRVLLAALLLRGGRVAATGDLAEALWGGQPPPSARESLQNYVARLRRALGGGDRLIVTEPGGYRIALRAGELDADRFEAALTAGRAAARAGDWARAAAVLAEGLALWRGEPLTGIDSDVLAARHGARLAELRWQATEVLAEAGLSLGRPAEVSARLRRLTAEQPLRERLQALLILALYRDGQQGAALAAYQDARAVLAAELGAEPGPQLRDLHQQILTADPALAGPAQSGPAPAPAGARGLEVRYALPPDAAAFTGRGEELGQITAAAAAAGVVSVSAINGMPGAGKTALAVHAAYALAGQFPDRQLFINLRGHTPGRDPVTPEDALAGLLAAAGTDPASLPADLAARTALWRDTLAGQRVLLILDNAASSAQVAPLLPGSGGCLVLVTSRRHLGDLPGAVTPVLVGVLTPGQAAEMFTRLAPRAASHPEQVAEVVALAGFLPLAISLLARLFARHQSWTLADLAAETRASLLTLAAEDASVAAAFELSFRHLDPARQRLFALLGLHPGATTDAYAAAALAGITMPEAARLLDGLHGEGLVAEAGYRRYGLHDLLRRYARERSALASAATADAATGRLLDYYIRAAARADARLARRAPPIAPSGPPAIPDLADESQALAWARAERPGLLACLDHAAAAGQQARVVALTAGLTQLLRRDGPWAEAIARHTAAARAAGQLGDRPGQAGALSDLGITRQLTDDYPEAADLLEQALGIYRNLGDRLGQASVLSDLGSLRRLAGAYPAAARELEQAQGIYRDLGDRRGQATVLNSLGVVQRRTGDYAAAVQSHQQALIIYRDLGHRRGQASALTCLGVVRQMTGDYPAAARDLEQSLAMYRDLSSPLGEAGALNNLGVVRRLTGDYPAAAAAHEQALRIFRELGDRGGEAMALNERGALFRVSGDVAGAEEAHRQALHLAREIASAWDEAHAVAGLGRCALVAGDAEQAGVLLRQALENFRRIGAAEAPGLAAELAALSQQAAESAR